MFVWLKDENHRVYEDNAGNRTSAPNYAKMWIKHEVTRETSRSYIVQRYGETKIPKNRDLIVGDWVAFSEGEVADFVYKHEHGYKIAEQVRLASPETLRRIAKLIGYESS